jgi:hypothetical protein
MPTEVIRWNTGRERGEKKEERGRGERGERERGEREGGRERRESRGRE